MRNDPLENFRLEMDKKIATLYEDKGINVNKVANFLRESSKKIEIESDVEIGIETTTYTFTLKEEPYLLKIDTSFGKYVHSYYDFNGYEYLICDFNAMIVIYESVENPKFESLIKELSKKL